MNFYASGVIQDGAGRFLTIHHSKKKEHQWRFVGGKINGDELPIIACARETHEEIGIVPTSLKLVSTQTTHVDGGDWTGQFFLIEDYHGTIVLQEPDKHSEYRYMTVKELVEANSHPEAEVAADLTYSHQS